jgi:hypoxanthine phosphoribosyltransferase
MNWWIVPGLVVGLSGFTFAVLNERRRRRQVLHRQQRFEWDHVYQGVRQLCRAIARDGFMPDVLIGIPGAGLILDTLAVIEWGDSLPVYVIHQEPIDALPPANYAGVTFETSKWRYFISMEVLSLSQKKVLILDDYAHAGDTLRELRRVLETNGFRRDHVRTAALVANTGLKEIAKAPDYVWFWVDTFDVHMPWGHASKRVRKGELRA